MEGDYARPHRPSFAPRRRPGARSRSHGKRVRNPQDLSDAPDHELRMADLAKSTGLSATRTTRLADDLQEHGLLAKVASSADARSTRARILPKGMAKLKLARQVHVEIVRDRFFDHIDSSSIRQLVDALSTVARQLEDSSRRAVQ